jgi:hypothetical protein
VKCRFVRILFFGCILLAAGVSRFWAQSSQSSAQLRRTILHSRHLGAHGVGYNDRSLTELSQKLSAADVPTLIALSKDSDVKVGAQFALASQCQGSLTAVVEGAKQHHIDFLDAADVMDLISGFAHCDPVVREKARQARDEIDQLRKEDQARVADEAKREAENDARIQANSIKMTDGRSKELSREEREEVYQRSLKAMGLNEKGPLTPAQKQIVDRMYRTMVLGEAGQSSRE